MGKEKILNGLLESSKKDLIQVTKILEKYNFWGLLAYMVLSMNNRIAEGRPIADCPTGIVEYAISLVLGIENPGEEVSTEVEGEVFMDKVTVLWGRAGLASTLMGNDDFISKISGYFLTVRGHDYDEHLKDHLIGLFEPFNDFFENKLGFSLQDALDLFTFSQEVDITNPFVINPNNSKTRQTIEFFASKLGENKKFLEGEYGGLFGNRSIVPEKSIVSYQDNYFVFQPLLIIQNIKTNFEKVLKKDHSVWNQYEKNRAKFLEDKSIEYISDMLPGSIGYTNLKYEGDKETDGLILYDNNIFIIEAKAGVLRTASIKGEKYKKELEEDIDSLMIKGYNQAIRTKEYIENNSVSEFFVSGKKIKIERKDVNKIFLINTTGDYLGPIAINLDIQKDKGKLDEKINFWSIYINDLRVISDLIDFPSQFLLFLERRRNLINLPQLHFSDELDIFMDFLNRGLYFNDGKVYGEEINDFTNVIMDTTTTDDIDRYYWGEKAKPIMNIREDYKGIIESVEGSGKNGFSEVSTFLLSINQDSTMNLLTKLKDEFLTDGKLHSFTGFHDEIKILDLFICKGEHEKLDKESYIAYSKVKLGQVSGKKAYNIYFGVNTNGEIIFDDFDIITVSELEKTEQYKKAVGYLEKKSHGFRADVRTGKKLWEGKLYRKSPCPCGSGKKYKRCCWDKY